jgi:uncharacterized protein (TIGR02996 family)
MTDTDHRSLLRLLTDAPDDWQTRLILADWYEEHGEDDKAHAQRWMVENQKHPAGGAKNWTWFCEGRVRSTDLPQTNIPEDIFDLLPWKPTDFRWGDPVKWIDYPSLQKAEDALAVALVKKGK